MILIHCKIWLSHRSIYYLKGSIRGNKISNRGSVVLKLLLLLIFTNYFVWDSISIISLQMSLLNSLPANRSRSTVPVSQGSRSTVPVGQRSRSAVPIGKQFLQVGSNQYKYTVPSLLRTDAFLPEKKTQIHKLIYKQKYMVPPPPCSWESWE